MRLWVRQVGADATCKEFNLSLMNHLLTDPRLSLAYANFSIKSHRPSETCPEGKKEPLAFFNILS